VVYRDAKVRDIVAIGGKDGFVTALDRDSHEVLFHTAVTTVGPTPAAATPAGVNSCPGYAGGVEWNGPALDTANNTLVVGAVDACFKVTLGKTQYSPGDASFGGTVAPYGPTTGWITSVDAQTGAVRWKYHAEKPVVAGITPTAGGVTFAGDLAGNLLVFNSKSGELLRKVQTGGSLAGGMITYQIGDRQYLAFADGNVSRNAFGALGLPSIVIMTLNPPLHAMSLVSPGALMPADEGPGATPTGGPGGAAAAGITSGQRFYQQICSACHGSDGNMIADHKLSTLKGRMNHATTVAFIKNPKAPMPKMYPQLLKDRDVADIVAYLEQDIVK
jgi:cytochrome c553